jgi:hypothetical protein
VLEALKRRESTRAAAVMGRTVVMCHTPNGRRLKVVLAESDRLVVTVAPQGKAAIK